MTVLTKTPSTHSVEVVHPSPEEAHKMPYAPAVRIVGACDLMFISGVTPSQLYHHHPHRDEEHIHPHGIEEQTKRAMDCAKTILDEVGGNWKDVVKITKYLTDMRDADGMNRAMAPYLGDWRPASTMVCINQLSSPGARVRRERATGMGDGQTCPVQLANTRDFFLSVVH